MAAMKLAFTTLGCPDWDLATATRNGKAYGFEGIDIRTIRGTNRVFELEEFTSGLSDSVATVEKSGLELTCFSSSVKAYPGADELPEHLAELRSYVELCRAFGVRRIRIFGGTIDTTPRDRAIEIAIDNCRRYLDLAAPHGVDLLFETHDSWTGSPHIQRVLEAVDSEHLKVVWDLAHPYRYSSESPQETWDRLGKWVANTHWKDARGGGERESDLCLVGEGDLPLGEFKRVLDAGGYDGYYTLEWEKMWHPELEEPEVAFPRFVEFMRGLE